MADHPNVTIVATGRVTDIRAIAATRSKNEAAVRDVLADTSLIRPVFQPIADLARGRVCGYELLTRFASQPEGSPERWFAAADRAGLSGQLESAVLRHALEARRKLPPNCFLSVNLSPHAAVTPEVRSLLAQQSDMGALVIEVTEQAPVDDYDELLAALAPARAAGAALAIDDVGTGYAGLEHIMALRPNFVKTDRSLVRAFDTDEVRAAGVEMLGLLASRIDAWLIAEGLETAAELEAALALGVPLGQGFGLARPGAMGADIVSEAKDILTARTQAPAGAGTVGDCVESLPVWLPGVDPHAWRVQTDERMRPLALVGPAQAPIEQPMSVLATEALTDVALRALTRPAGERFTPLVCCDELGRVCGLVRIERVMKALAERAGGA